MKLYRGMMEDTDNLPVVGPTKRKLGVKPSPGKNADVPAVNPSDPVTPAIEGMSVAPEDPMRLPEWRRPPSLGGTGDDPVWWIDSDELGPVLQFFPDQGNDEHGLIGVTPKMTLQEFQDALAQTRPRWKLHCR